MTYEEFVADLPVSFERKTEGSGREYREVPGSEYIQTEWITGGQSGGDCWGSENRPIDAEPEPEFVALDRVLERACPHLSFLQYKAISRDCLHYGSRECREYYGNYSEYEYKRVYMRELHEKLRSLGLIS